MTLAALWHTLRNLLNHPLGRRDRFGTLVRFARWQIGSRILGAAVAMPFVDGSRLLVRAGMHGATGNIYVGLMEFEDMAFVLHLLRKGDAFLDVGANVGAYSLLAAGRGAQVLALEPVPDTFEQLLDNLYLNRFQTRVNARNIGVSSARGELRFSTQSGPTNHVLVEGEVPDNAVSVAVHTLDEIAASIRPTMIKIDVEGYEAEVIRGAHGVLSENSLQAVLIELNGLGARYGFKDAEIHARLLAFGLGPARYDPFTRRLIALNDHQGSGNTLYVRSSPEMDKRLQEAPPFIWRHVPI